MTSFDDVSGVNRVQRHDSLDSAVDSLCYKKNTVDHLRQVILKDNSLSM